MFIICHAGLKIGPFQLADDAANYACSRIGDRTDSHLWTIEMLKPPTPSQLPPPPPPDTGGLTKKGI